jgi:hypothetical protein
MNAQSHLSDWALDQLALEPDAAAREHLNTCARCSARSSDIAQQRRKAMESPRFEAVWSSLQRVPPRRRWWRFAFVPAFAGVAAASILWIRPARHDAIRPKGGYSVAVWTAHGRVDGSQPVRPGENVSLSVNTLGRKYALILGVDEAGAVAVVWPPGAGQSGETPAAPARPLAPAFKVTPGSLTLEAFFSDKPIPAQAAIESLRRRVAANGPGAQSGQSIPVLPFESGRASTVLEVR